MRKKFNPNNPVHVKEFESTILRDVASSSSSLKAAEEAIVTAAATPQGRTYMKNMLGGKAHVMGADISFTAGEYKPRAVSVLAHELAHVIQQKK